MIQATSNRILVFREPRQETSAGGIILAQTKICNSRVVVILSRGKDADPDMTTGARAFAYAFDSITEFFTDKECVFEVENTTDDIRFPPGVSREGNKITVKAGVELLLLGHDMITFLVGDTKISDQNEVF